MFVAYEVRLEVGFPVALASLRNLATGCSLTGASRDAYDETITSLMRVGPVGATPGVSRLVSVSFVDPVMREGSAILGMRWNADGPGGGLFPALDAGVCWPIRCRAVATWPLAGTGAGLRPHPAGSWPAESSSPGTTAPSRRVGPITR
jgi:hypothetical protein